MIGSSGTLLAGGALAILGSGALAGGWYLNQKATERAEARVEATLEDADGPIALPAPEVSLSPMDYFRAMRHLQTQQTAAKKGYIKWFRLGSNMKRPQWVKPKPSGSGPPKKSVDGQPYYFDKAAMTIDERTGAYVAVHRVGESDPINLNDPAYPGIEADRMERIINLEAEDKPPGLFDGLADMDMQTLVWLSIGVLFIVFAAYRYMG